MYPEICEEWDDPLSPKDFLPNSNKKVWWRCRHDSSHRWQASPNNRITGGSGCPDCNQSGGESMVRRILEDCDVEFSQQYRFPDCKFKRSLPFDFAVRVKDKIALIEFHGGQHYCAVDIFGGKNGHDNIIRSDKIKQDYCVMNGIDLLIVPYHQSKNAKKLVKEFLNSL
jgi:hypothetical protein